VIVVGLVVLGGLLPIVAYWAVLGRVPSLAPAAAKERLSAPDSPAVLVDVRTPEEFLAGHLEAAENWPTAQIETLAAADALPQRLQGKQLLLICSSGIRSRLATTRLRNLGVKDVWNVQGGMQAWVAAAEKPCALGLCRLRQASGESAELPYRDSPLIEQGLAVWTGFFVKPLYTVLSPAIAVILWRSTAPDLVALRWAMLAFFVGENFCAANYLVYSDGSLLFEFLHSYGMALCFGFAVFAVLEGIDLRLVKYSDPQARCAAVGLCHRCIKHVAAPCGLQRTFLLVIPAVMVLCGMPFCADLLDVSYNTRVFGTFYNYSHPVLCQIFEIRYLPAAALLLLTVSWVVLWINRADAVWWSKVFFAAGCGAFGFAFLRLILMQVYRDNLVWYSTWEELTELLFVVGAGWMLWIFRHGLFGSAPARTVDESR